MYLLCKYEKSGGFQSIVSIVLSNEALSADDGPGCLCNLDLVNRAAYLPAGPCWTIRIYSSDQDAYLIKEVDHLRVCLSWLHRLSEWACPCIGSPGHKVYPKFLSDSQSGP